MSEIAESIAEDVKQPVENQSITVEQLAARRFNSRKAKAETPKAPEAATEEKPKEDAEVKVSTNKEGDTKTEAKSEGKEVLSQVDLTELSDEDIAELAQKGKSGLLKRIAELTAKRKLAEERSAQLEGYLRQQTQNKPIEAKVENNPFASVKTIEELAKKGQDALEIIEWAEDVIDRAEGLTPDDVAATVDGRQLTKAEVKQILRDNRRARDKFLPAQQKELMAKVQRVQMRESYEAAARKEFDWLSSDEDNDTKVKYRNMLADPRLKTLDDSAPEIATQLPYLLAHAANSMFGRKSIAIDSPKSPSVKPPASPTTSAAQSDQPASREDKGLKERSKRLESSGSVSDFVALRTAQFSKRKLIK